jgi:hypothetical protein
MPKDEGGESKPASDADNPSEPSIPLNYAGTPKEDSEAAKQWERDHLSEHRRFARESLWMDLTSNWWMWLVVIIAAIIIVGCFGRNGFLWELIGRVLRIL